MCVTSVNKYKDPIYGTPIFKTVAGTRSSCPYEGGYQRDQPSIRIIGRTENNITLSNTTLGTPATFQVKLCNNNSTEARSYKLGFVSPSNSSDLLITAAGSTGENFGTFPVNPNTCRIENYDVNISRRYATSEINFTNLEFQFYPECDPDLKASLFANISFAAPLQATGVAASKTDICTGTPVILTATCPPNTTPNWYTSATGGFNVASGSSVSVNPSANTIYYVGCETANYVRDRVATSPVVVKPIPTIQAFSNTQTICSGATTTLSATCSVGSSPVWYVSDIATTGTSGASFTSPTLNASTTYFVACETGGTANCVSTRQQIVVNVLAMPTPMATASSNSPICAGTTLNLLGGGIGTSYAWTSSNSFTSTGQSPSIPNASISASGTYTITVTNASGCTSTATTSVTVSTLPSINAPTITQPTCTLPTSGTIVVNAMGNGTLEYSIDNGSTWQTSATFSGLSVGNYTIKVRIQNAPSCEVIYGSNPVVLTLPFTASTTIDTWTGCISTNWATPGNWADGSVPTAADDAVIPNTTNKPTIVGGTAAVAKTIEVQSGATFTIAATASLTVNGSKSVPSGGSTAFLNDGTVQNNGQLNLGNSSEIGGEGLYNRGVFNNNTGGDIKIDRSTNRAIFNRDATFNNSALITIGALASVGQRGLNNFGTTAMFNNNMGGEIKIDNATRTGLFNESGIFTNAAKITIGATASIGGEGIDNRSTFNNNTGGDIKIDNVTSTGLKNEGGSTFTNAAKITIGASTSIGGEGIDNRSTFNNNTGGEIKIDRTGRGLLNHTATFNNSALITIGALASVGARGLNNFGATAQFNNNAGGEIKIDNATSIGLFNESGTFTNAAKITIGGVVLGAVNGLQNDATFNNNACAQLNVVKGTLLNNAATTFTNIGLVNVSNTLTNNGTFTNSGVVKANTVPSITNNKMLITNACPIFTLGGTNNYTVNGIFTDATATTSAGTYSSVGNKFTANNTIPTSTQTLYAQVTDNTCTFVVPFDFNNVKPTAVSVNDTTVCTGGSVTLSATCASGTPTWYTTATGGSSIGTGTSLSNSPTVATTYYAACETTNCVSGRVASKLVLVVTPSTVLNLTTDFTTSTIQIANTTITASNKIFSPASVTYKAGNSLIFNPGFEAKSGSNFMARIGGCN